MKRMENHKGKSQMYPFSANDQVIKIDLTLKLGLSIYDKQNVVEENKDVGSSAGLGCFSSVVDQAFEDKVNFSLQLGQATNGRVELNSSSGNNYYNGNEGVELGSTTNYNLFYQGCSSGNYTVTPSRKRVNNGDDKICKFCGSDDTPLWRKGPNGPQTLCNACGLRHLRSAKKKA